MANDCLNFNSTDWQMINPSSADIYPSIYCVYYLIVYFLKISSYWTFFSLNLPQTNSHKLMFWLELNMFWSRQPSINGKVFGSPFKSYMWPCILWFSKVYLGGVYFDGSAGKWFNFPLLLLVLFWLISIIFFYWSEGRELSYKNALILTSSWQMNIRIIRSDITPLILEKWHFPHFSTSNHFPKWMPPKSLLI